MSARGIWPTRPQPGLRSFSLACGPRAFGGGVTDQELTAQLAQARLDLAAAEGALRRARACRAALRDPVRDPLGLLLALLNDDGAAARKILSVWDRREFVIPLAAMAIGIGQDLVGEDEFADWLEEYALEMAGQGAPS